MRLVAARAASARSVPVSTTTQASAVESAAAVSLASTIGPVSGCCLWRRKRKRHIQRALDAVDAHLAIALGGVAVAATEECAVIEDGQIEPGAGAKFAHVEIAAEGSGRAGAECAIVGARYAHDAEKRANRHDGGRE